MSASAAHLDPLRASGRRTGTRFARTALVVLFATGAGAGVLFSSPGQALLAGAVGGVGGALATAVLHMTARGHWPAPRALLGAGTGVAALLAFITGVDVLGTTGSVLAVVVVVLLAVASGTWLEDLLGAPRATAAASPDAGATSVREVLAVLPLEVLFAEWRGTEEALLDGCREPLRADVVRLRELLLEEFRRRDPAGVRAWLERGADGPPEHHLGGGDGAA